MYMSQTAVLEHIFVKVLTDWKVDLVLLVVLISSALNVQAGGCPVSRSQEGPRAAISPVSTGAAEHCRAARQKGQDRAGQHQLRHQRACGQEDLVLPLLRCFLT